MKKNTITLAIMAILFSLTNCLSINAAEPLTEKEARELSKTVPASDASSKSLVVKNSTRYSINITTPNGQAFEFPPSKGLKEEKLTVPIAIGASGSGFTIKLTNTIQNPKIDETDLKAASQSVVFQWSKGNPYNHPITFPTKNSDNVQIQLNLEYDKNQVLHLTFTPA